MTTETVTNTERLKHFVDLMNAGKYDDARQMVSPKWRVREPDVIPYGGVHEGLEGFDNFRKIFAATWKRWVDGPFTYTEGDDCVIKYNVITATSRVTGREYTTPLAELFRFEDGLLVEAIIFYQDIPGFLAAIDPNLPDPVDLAAD